MNALTDDMAAHFADRETLERIAKDAALYLNDAIAGNGTHAPYIADRLLAALEVAGFDVSPALEGLAAAEE